MLEILYNYYNFELPFPLQSILPIYKNLHRLKQNECTAFEDNQPKISKPEYISCFFLNITSLRCQTTLSWLTIGGPLYVVEGQLISVGISGSAVKKKKSNIDTSKASSYSL